MSLQVVWTVANDGAVNLLDLSTLEPIKTIVSSNEELSVPLDEHEYFPLSSRCAVSSTSNSSLLPSAWLITSPPAKIMKSLTSSFCHYFLHSYFLNGKIPQFHSAPCNSHTMSGTETKLTAWEKDLSPFFKIITTDKWTCMVMTSDGQFVLVGTSLGKLLVWRVSRIRYS